MTGSISGINPQASFSSQSLQQQAGNEQQDRVSRNREEQEQDRSSQVKGAAVSTQPEQVEESRNKQDDQNKADARNQNQAANSNKDTSLRRGSLVDVVV